MIANFSINVADVLVQTLFGKPTTKPIYHYVLCSQNHLLYSTSHLVFRAGAEDCENR